MSKSLISTGASQMTLKRNETLRFPNNTHISHSRNFVGEITWNESCNNFPIIVSSLRVLIQVLSRMSYSLPIVLHVHRFYSFTYFFAFKNSNIFHFLFGTVCFFFVRSSILFSLTISTVCNDFGYDSMWIGFGHNVKCTVVLSVRNIFSRYQIVHSHCICETLSASACSQCNNSWQFCDGKWYSMAQFICVWGLYECYSIDI